MSAVRALVIAAVAAVFVPVLSCSDHPTAPAADGASSLTIGTASTASVTVTSTSPSDAIQDTTLDVQVNGSGFDRSSTVTFQLNGLTDSRVHVNSTKYSKSTQLVANVTIAADADATQYDVVVQTSTGLKGIGSEMFAVTLRPAVLANGTHARGVNVNGDAVGDGPGTVSGCGTPLLWPAAGGVISLPLGSFCGGGAQYINSSGVILGSLAGGAPDATGLWTPSAGVYSLQEIPPTSDGIRPVRSGLNDNTQTVGWHEQSAVLYWWSAATGWLTMQSPAGATRCSVFGKAINNAGGIEATCAVNGGALNGYYWSAYTAAPVMLPRPTGATADIYAHGINDNGVIVGYQNSSPTRALEWTPDGAGGYVVSYLPDLGLGSAAYAVGDDGTAVGSVTKVANSPRPAMWSAGGSGFAFLGLPGGVSWGEADDIAVTNSGLVVVGTGANTKALRWSAP